MVLFLSEWWPHFGTPWCSETMKIPEFKIKSKVDKLGLKMLEKTQRLCITCKVNYQYFKNNKKNRTKRECKECELKERRSKRKEKARQDKTWEELFKEISRTLRYRNRKIHNSTYQITADELMNIYKKQEGKCYYTKREMIKPIRYETRLENVLSVDRYDSNKAYTPDNIVLCTYIANIAKMDSTADQFVGLCKDVYLNSNQYHPL